MRRRAVRLVAVALAATGGGVGASVAGAQSLPLKRSVAVTPADACADVPPVAAGAATANSEAAQQSLRRAREAALLGDLQGTRANLAEAAALDPRNAAIALELGRTLDDMGERRPALAEYCRYLRITPTGGDADATRARVLALAPDVGASRRRAAAALFDSAVAHADARRLNEAELAFTRVLTVDPGAAEAYFDRALVRAAQKRRTAAAADLQDYLARRGDASDRSIVERQIRVLRTPPPNAGGALASGIFIPGGGQFATRRPLRGLVVAGAVGGAAFWAFREQERTVVRRFVDPFGNPYDSPVRETHQPNRTVGIAAAGGMMLAAAVESFLFARRERAQLEERYLQFGVVMMPGGAVVAAPGVGMRLEVPWQIGRGGRPGH